LEGLFELFASNPFFLLIIIFVIARFLFAGSKQTNQKQNQQEQQGKKPTLRSLLEEALNEGNVEKSKQVVEEKKQPARDMTRQTISDVRKSADQEVKSIEQAHEEQLERFKSMYQPTYEKDDFKQTNQTADKMASQLANNVSSAEYYHTDLDLQITQKKLMESIVMAEVLGPPRALNRYENIAMRRRK